MSEENKKVLSNNGQTVSQQFSNGWQLFNKIENSSDPSNSSSYQTEVKSCIDTLIRCTHMVNILALFSSNEHHAELSTDTLKFLLLPAFLGELSLKLMTDDRKNTIIHALTYFKSFLKHCNDYKISGEKDLSPYVDVDDIADEVKGKLKMDASRSNTREEKIKRFQESKELESKIKIIHERLEKDSTSVDEGVIRCHYLNCLKLWINKGIENIASIKSELEILDHMDKLRQGKIQPEANPKERKPVKPILITREMIRKQVFGAGYKSLPTMTEDEYFEKEVREGKIVLDYDSKKNANVNCDEEKDDKDDSGDDEEKLKKARDWDEWKDTHRRGEGNKERNG